MIRLGGVTGLPVVCAGQLTGRVEQTVLTQDGRRLRGLVVRRGFGGARWLPVEDVQVMGQVTVIAARKPGKLPRATYAATYELEYGSDALEIHQDALTPDDVVLIVDDLVATGGTTTAMVRLVRASGAHLAGLGFVMELAFLSPRAVIAEETDAEVFSLIAVEGEPRT